jgi:hypothetical protein
VPEEVKSLKTKYRNAHKEHPIKKSSERSVRQKKVHRRSKFLRQVTQDALLGGVMPIQVMLDNMRFYHGKAEELVAQILEDIKSSGKKLDQHHLEMLVKVYSFRNEAGKAACDAAPYCHPRLSAIAISATQTTRHEMPKDITLEDAVRIYNENVKMFPSADHSSPLLEHIKSPT